MYEITYGSKYQQGLDTAEIAKLIRADIKAAIAAGELPRATYSVKISRYSGGSSIHVKISGVPFPVLNAERARRDALEPYVYHAYELPLRTAEAEALLTTVELIVASYNYDGSDIQSDYFNVNFHSSVTFDHDEEREERERIVAAIKAA
jgi:hypothetical protein